MYMYYGIESNCHDRNSNGIAVIGIGMELPYGFRTGVGIGVELPLSDSELNCKNRIDPPPSSV